MRDLVPEPITAERFAPFGLLLPPRRPSDPRVELIEELQNLRATAKPRLGVIALQAASLPLQAAEMERHVHSSQTFVPIAAKAYLVLVAPHGPGGHPDMTRLCAFQVSGDVGIHYHAGTWHYPMTALDADARFVVMTFVDGTGDDEEFVRLPEPIRLVRSPA